MRKRNAISFTLLVISSALLSPVFAEEPKPASLIVEPAEITLNNADQRVQLLVTMQMSDASQRDVTRSAVFAIDKKQSGILSIENGRVTPLADGTAIVKITAQDAQKKKKLTTTAKITVQGCAQERPIHFTNEVIPVLTKAGCNAGACHGKATGQNGFSLSLLGFEPDFDYDALVKEGRGRRLFPAAPEQSLLLKKATGQALHGGGPRISAGSADYQLLLRWIEQGMPKGSPDAPKVAQIEVFPRERIVGAANEQQLRVVAHYTDNSTQDVTQKAEYKSQQPDILKVDPTGLVNTLDRTGEGAVMVRYMGFVDVAKFSVPYSADVPADAYAHFTPRGYVDQAVLDKWHKLGIAPSPVCGDEQFIRRAFLDAIGTLPTAGEVRTFCADTAPDKRDKLVDAILERPEYADFWANLWGDLLRNRREGEEQKRGTFAFAAWIRDSFAQNKPYDKFVGDILTAQGEVGDNPAVNWYRTVRNQVHLVNDSSQLFLGTRMSCANCHHHPYEKLSQNDYWGYAAFFSRVGKKQGDVPADQAIFVQKTGETTQPRSGKQVKPKGLNGAEYEYVRGEDPRVNLMKWMTAPDNPYFSKAIANRMWGHFMGIGIVNAVDDMRVTNPPSNPALLDGLAKDFVEHKFDLKHLIKTIMKSQVYQLSSDPSPYNATDRQNYARYRTKRLSAEVLLDAVCSVTGSPEKFPGLPLGTRAIELPDNAVGSYFLHVFGRSERETACECERSYAPNLAQTLHLMNSSEIQGKLSSDKGRIAELLKAKKASGEMIEDLYLSSFGRRPAADEAKDAAALLDAATDKKAAVEDFCWMLLNSKEFLFNH